MGRRRCGAVSLPRRSKPLRSRRASRAPLGLELRVAKGAEASGRQKARYQGPMTPAARKLPRPRKEAPQRWIGSPQSKEAPESVSPPGAERSKPQTSRAGRRGSGHSVVTCSCESNSTLTRGCGVVVAPAFRAPSFLEDATRMRDQATACPGPQRIRAMTRVRALLLFPLPALCGERWPAEARRAKAGR